MELTVLMFAVAGIIDLFLIFQYRRHGAAGLRLAIIGLTTVLGAVVGSLLLTLSSRERGVWYPLIAPPEPAIEILGHDTSTGTYFRTEGGVYACGWECTKIAKMPDPSKLCKPVGSSVPPAPGEVADSLEVDCHGADVTITFGLVLLKDGRAFRSEVFSWSVSNLCAVSIGGVVGLIAGVIIVIAMSKRRSPA